MPRTRRSIPAIIASKNDMSPKKDNALTPQKPLAKKKKRTASDRSPAVKARKKTAPVQETDYTSDVAVRDHDNKENHTPPRATPYWKVSSLFLYIQSFICSFDILELIHHNFLYRTALL